MIALCYVFIVIFTKNMSFFDSKILPGINFNENSAQKSSILIVYKLIFVCYNDTVLKIAWAYSGLYERHGA